MAGKRMGAGGNFASVAGSLGIARHEISQLFNSASAQTYSNYPKLECQPLPLQLTTELSYLADVAQEITLRYHEAPFYESSDAATSKSRDIHRYTDKYRTRSKPVYTPVWHRLPAELQWGKQAASRGGGRAAKKPRLDLTKKNVDSKLDELEAAESRQESDDKSPVKEKKTKEGDKSDGEEEAENELSDEDYLEEGNDYIENYFDNGEEYGDVDSGDNLDNDDL